MDVNRFTLIGRAARQPELKQNAAGKDYCFLTVAASEKGFKDKPDAVSFIQVIVGGKQAAIVCDRVGKGDQLAVEGKIRIKKGDKAKGTYDSISLSADNVVFVQAPHKAPDDSEPERGDDDLI